MRGLARAAHSWRVGARARRAGWLALGLFAGCGLSPLPEGATTYGSANRGVLLNGVPLPKAGQGYVQARPGDAHYGTPRLVAALTRAAAQVARSYPGASPLRIGDLSSRYGGNHSRHGSHRSGRDADILFYLLDETGNSMAGSGFFAFDERGVSAYAGRLAFFDTARNWALVRALIQDEEAEAQWLFCSDGIKARLLTYAAEHETDPRVLMRAAYVLHQPSYGNPHRDHFHLRVACSAEELARGCIDDGPVWPWLRNEHEKPAWGAGKNDDATLIEALLRDAE